MVPRRASFLLWEDFAWDPVSSLIFVLVRKLLSRMLRTPVGFFMGGLYSLHLEISHFFFADAIIFCDNECELILNLHCILMWLEAISSLRVNLMKSFILPVLLVGEVNIAHVLAGISVVLWIPSYLITWDSLLGQTSREV